MLSQLINFCAESRQLFLGISSTRPGAEIAAETKEQHGKRKRNDDGYG